MGEEDSGLSCRYCSCAAQHSGCRSLWDGDLHYIVHNCSCGKESWFRADLDFDPTSFFKKTFVEPDRKRVMGAGD